MGANVCQGYAPTRESVGKYGGKGEFLLGADMRLCHETTAGDETRDAAARDRGKVELCSALPQNISSHVTGWT